MTITSTGLITWVPLEGVLTSTEVTITVSDGGENFSTPAVEMFTITVTSVNDQPVISSTPSLSAVEVNTYSYPVVVTDPDDDNNGTDLLYVLAGEPDGMTISPLGLISWIPPEGTTTSGVITLTVSDGGENGTVAAEQSFTLALVSLTAHLALPLPPQQWQQKM